MKRFVLVFSFLIATNVACAESQQVDIPAKAVGMAVYVPPEQVTRFCFKDRSLASISMDNNEYKLW